METKELQINFAVCLATSEDEDLEVGKVYRILPDAKAAAVGYLRVIDESDEDYFYPAKRFMVLDLPEPERERLRAALDADAA